MRGRPSLRNRSLMTLDFGIPGLDERLESWRIDSEVLGISIMKFIIMKVDWSKIRNLVRLNWNEKMPKCRIISVSSVLNRVFNIHPFFPKTHGISVSRCSVEYSILIHFRSNTRYYFSSIKIIFPTVGIFPNFGNANYHSAFEFREELSALLTERP